MKTIKMYSAKELKDKFPEAFEKAHKKHVDSVSSRGIDWQDEIMDSLKAIFKASDINLTDWSISDTERSYVKFYDLDANADTFSGRKALNWIKNQLGLKSVKRVNYIHNGKKYSRFDVVKSDGKDWSCEFTGVCFDHDFLDDLLESVTKDGFTLSDAYHHLADKAGELFYQEYINQCSEEYFLDEAEANDYQYTEDGLMV